MDSVAEAVVPYIASDGFTDDIVIPTVMVAKVPGQRLLSFMCAGLSCGDDANADYSKKKLSVSMKFEMPHQHTTAHWTLWTSPTDTHSAQLKKQFLPAAVALGRHAKLTLHYLIHSGKSLGCQPWGRFDCSKQCTNGGRYCLEDPDGDAGRGLDGSDVVRLVVQQLCIFNATHQGDADDSSWKFWAFMSLYEYTCQASASAARACRDDSSRVAALLSSVGISEGSVSECVEASGGFDANQPNSILETELQVGAM